MPSPLAWRRSPGADQPDCLSALGEHYHEGPTAAGSPEQDEALFVCRMAGIVDDLAKRITECRDRFIERDLVLREIERRLAWVPLERQRSRQLSIPLQDIDRCTSDRGRLGFRRLCVNAPSCRRQPRSRTRPEIIARRSDLRCHTSRTPSAVKVSRRCRAAGRRGLSWRGLWGGGRATGGDIASTAPPKAAHV